MQQEETEPWEQIFSDKLIFFEEEINDSQNKKGQFSFPLCDSKPDQFNYLLTKYLEQQDILHEQFLFHGNVIKVAKLHKQKDRQYYFRLSIPDFNGDKTYIQNIQQIQGTLTKDTISGYYHLRSFFLAAQSRKQFSEFFQQKDQKILFVCQYLAQVYKILVQNGFLLDTQPNLTNIIVHWDQKHQLPTLVLIPTFSVFIQYWSKYHTDFNTSYIQYLKTHQRHFGYLLNNICWCIFEESYEYRIDQFYQNHEIKQFQATDVDARSDGVYSKLEEDKQQFKMFQDVSTFFPDEEDSNITLKYINYWLINEIPYIQQVYFDLRCKYQKSLLSNFLFQMSDNSLKLLLNLFKEEDDHLKHQESPNKAEFITKLFNLLSASVSSVANQKKQIKFLLTDFQKQFFPKTLKQNYPFIETFKHLIDFKEQTNLSSIKIEPVQTQQSNEQKQQKANDYKVSLVFNQPSSSENKNTPVNKAAGPQQIQMEKKNLIIEYLEQKNCLVVKSPIEEILMTVDQGDDLVALTQNLMFQEGYANIYFNDKRQLTIQHSICTGSPIYILQSLIQMIDMQIIITIGILEIYNTKINVGRSTKDYRFKLIVPEIIHYLRDYERQSNDLFSNLFEVFKANKDFKSLFLSEGQ